MQSTKRSKEKADHSKVLRPLDPTKTLLRANELAIKCNVSAGHISMAKKRGIIIKTPDGFFDIENPKNKAYIDGCIAKKTAAGKFDDLKFPEKKTTEFDIEVETIEPVTEIKDKETEALELYLLDKNKKILDNQKREVEIRILNMKEEATKGNLIPTNMVANLVSELSRQFINSYNEGVELFVINFAHKHKLKGEASAALTGGLKEMINKAHDKAILSAKSNLESITEQAKS